MARSSPPGAGPGVAPDRRPSGPTLLRRLPGLARPNAAADARPGKAAVRRLRSADPRFPVAAFVPFQSGPMGGLRDGRVIAGDWRPGSLGVEPVRRSPGLSARKRHADGRADCGYRGPGRRENGDSPNPPERADRTSVANPRCAQLGPVRCFPAARADRLPDHGNDRHLREDGLRRHRSECSCPAWDARPRGLGVPLGFRTVGADLQQRGESHHRGAGQSIPWSRKTAAFSPWGN